MKNFRIFFAIIIVGVISGCAVAQSRIEKLPTVYSLPGTTTAVVGIAIDKRGYPKETVKEIVLHPGEKVVFAGPDNFLIAFKENKIPDKKVRYKSENGVIKIVIPEDILERPEFREEYAKYKYVKFNYAINVNGKELDPPIIIRRDE